MSGRGGRAARRRGSVEATRGARVCIRPFCECATTPVQTARDGTACRNTQGDAPRVQGGRGGRGAWCGSRWIGETERGAVVGFCLAAVCRTKAGAPLLGWPTCNALSSVGEQSRRLLPNIFHSRTRCRFVMVSRAGPRCTAGLMGDSVGSSCLSVVIIVSCSRLKHQNM